MESTLKIVAQLNISEHTVEHELRTLAEEIKEEIETEKQLNEEFEALALKIENAVHILREQEVEANTVKQTQKNEIKALNEHQMVGNKDISNKIEARQTQQKQIEIKMVKIDTKYEKDWMNHSKAIDTEFVELQKQNETLKKQIESAKHDINENETMFEELQKEIEIKRENILKHNREREECIAATNKTKQKIEKSRERIEALESKIGEKDTEIANEKLNGLEIRTKLAILRDFEINKQVFDQQIQNINELKTKNTESEQINAKLQIEIDQIYTKLEDYAETKLFPLQSMIRLNEPIVKQKEKEKQELMSETSRNEECLRNIKNQIETKQNDLNKTKQNESILNAKINEKQMEFKRATQQFETKKEDLIRIKKQLRKIRKESKGLRHDTQAMAQYMKQKESDGLLTFNKTELLRDFEIDSKGKDIPIFGEELRELEAETQREQKELNGLKQRNETLSAKELKPAMMKKNELEEANREEEAALKKQIETKAQIATDLSKINNVDIKIMKQKKEDLTQQTETANQKVIHQVEAFKGAMLMLQQFQIKTLKDIDALHAKHVQMKEPLQKENDKMSKNNIDQIYKLKKEFNDEKTRYQHSKVKLRAMQRK